jgi:hypothetical protein
MRSVQRTNLPTQSRYRYANIFPNRAYWLFPHHLSSYKSPLQWALDPGISHPSSRKSLRPRRLVQRISNRQREL